MEIWLNFGLRSVNLILQAVIVPSLRTSETWFLSDYWFYWSQGRLRPGFVTLADGITLCNIPSTGFFDVLPPSCNFPHLAASGLIIVESQPYVNKDVTTSHTPIPGTVWWFWSLPGRLLGMINWPGILSTKSQYTPTSRKMGNGGSWRVTAGGWVGLKTRRVFLVVLNLKAG